MVFIDDIDEEELMLKACAFSSDRGFNLDQTEMTWKEKNCLVVGYLAGYRNAIRDEKELYDEAVAKVQEAEKKARAKLLIEESNAWTEVRQKLEEQGDD